MTPRRWLLGCNPGLSNLISEKIGSTDEWITNLSALRQLSAYAKDPYFVKEFANVKRKNKMRLQKWVLKETGVEIPLDALYDV